MRGKPPVNLKRAPQNSEIAVSLKVPDFLLMQGTENSEITVSLKVPDFLVM